MRNTVRVQTINADRNDPLYKKLGALLTLLRCAQSQTQTQVAEALGLNSTTITLYEKGQNRVPLGVFVRWCEVLGQDPGAVLTAAMTEPLVPRQDLRQMNGKDW